MIRVKDWLNQGKRDLQAAQTSLENGHFEWSCFQSQQSAEKSFKALLMSLNIESWGHSLVHLARRLEQVSPKFKVNNDLLESCQELDRHYIQPRYPNGFANGYPAEFYNLKTAETCMSHAKKILSFVEEKIK
ncbi:MAG: HEPN domain-containing protein [Candidatus Hodarchaeales archaeon]